MCGIAGVWSRDLNDQRRTARALESIRHRGPDANGVYQDECVSLAHARLAIIDPEGGAQPMTLDALTVVFNGMIFNYRALRAELERCGARFRSACDTEVLLHGFRIWGLEGMLARLNGMFAFALYDSETHRLILARDRMGEKPLYYSRLPRGVAFASEIKGVLKYLDHVSLNIPKDWFVLENTLSPNTLFRNVRSLLPASYMIIQDGDIAAYEEYWSFPADPMHDIDEAAAVAILRDLVMDAVSIRTQSDVPVSMFLSGGLDSSIIACLTKPSVVFSAGYPSFDGKFSELDYARCVADWIGAEQVEVTLTRDDIIDIPRHLDHILEHLDQPISTSSTITSFRLAQAAARRGFKVILNGQGADEVFGGYARYVLMKQEHTLAQDPFYQQYTPMAQRLWGDAVFNPVESRYLTLNQRAKPQTRDALAFYASVMGDYSRLGLISQIGIIDAMTTLQDLIVMDDRACASVGIESRSPFLDYRLVEFGMRLPDELKIKGTETKRLLRMAMKGIVPDAILNRRDKMGMVSPLGLWLKHELRDWALEKISLARPYFASLSAPERGDYDRQLHAQVMMGMLIERHLMPA